MEEIFPRHSEEMLTCLKAPWQSSFSTVHLSTALLSQANHFGYLGAHKLCNSESVFVRCCLARSGGDFLKVFQLRRFIDRVNRLPIAKSMIVAGYFIKSVLKPGQSISPYINYQ